MSKYAGTGMVAITTHADHNPQCQKFLQAPTGPPHKCTRQQSIRVYTSPCMSIFDLDRDRQSLNARLNVCIAGYFQLLRKGSNIVG